MNYLDNLKKERSMDRVIFLAGMVLAFIGFLVPTVYVKQVTAAPVDNTIEEVEESSDDLLDVETTEAEEDDDDWMNAEAVEDDEESSDAAIVLKETVKDFVLDKNFDQVLDSKGNPKTEVKVTYSYITADDVEEGQKIETKCYNIFGLAASFNIAPTAYNSTFLVAMWLCSIAGIALFFITKAIIGDIVAILVGLGFAVASAISIPLTLHVFPIVGYMTVGGYMVIVGWIIAIVGSVLGAAHIKHPEIVKDI